MASPDGAADLLERLDRLLHLRGGDEGTFVLLRRRVERPDLHRRDAAFEQAFGQFVGARHEAFEILVGTAGRAEAPVGHGADIVRADIAVARAGVVDALALAAEAAQHLVHGLAAELAEEVPERDVQCRGGAVLDAGRGLGHRQVEHVAVDRLDPERGPAEQARGEGVVDMGLDRAGAVEGLAQSDQPRIGVHADPEDIGEFLGAQRFDRGDLHRRLPFLGWPRCAAVLLD